MKQWDLKLYPLLEPCSTPTCDRWSSMVLHYMSCLGPLYGKTWTWICLAPFHLYPPLLLVARWSPFFPSWHVLILVYWSKISLSGRDLYWTPFLALPPLQTWSYLMQSYPLRTLNRRLHEDWTRDAGEDPRVLMSLG